MSVLRPMGTELEYGILDREHPNTNPVQLSFDVIDAVATSARRRIRWDYRGEDPINDARGYHLPRSSARADMLTDTPQRFITNTVSDFGARCYVDHAHPEYSSAEVNTPRAAVAATMLGDTLMLSAAQMLQTQGRNIHLYRATTDGKGASWGAHESYQISRIVPFEQLADLMLAHFSSRIVLVGAGRVGIGERSERAGFQISQRADFMHARLGLQTTFERPIVNTRDESHSSSSMRRLHVISGDANCMPIPNMIKLGATSILAWLAECAYDPTCEGYTPAAFAALLDGVVPEDPVRAIHEFSHDLALQVKVPVRSGQQLTALEIQHRLFDEVHSVGAAVYGIADDESENSGDINRKKQLVCWPDQDTALVMQLWQQVLDDLDTLTGISDEERLFARDAASRIEWLLKWQIIERIRRKLHTNWAAAQCAACDIAWGALEPEESLYAKVSGNVQPLPNLDNIPNSKADQYRALYTQGLSDRARLRVALLNKWSQSIRAISWSSIVVCDTEGNIHEIHMEAPDDAAIQRRLQVIANSSSIEDVLRHW